jgi:Ala-tRNA(Pro) deacylase
MKGAAIMVNAMNGIKSHLLSNGIHFEELHHEEVGDPVEYSHKIGTRLEQQAKALLLRCKKNGGEKFFIVVSVPANKKVDFNAVSSKVGVGTKSIRVAEKEQMYELTGCEPGELPPLGKLWGVQLLFDEALFAEPKIYFNAGSLGYSIIANPHDIAKVEEAVII